MWVETFPSVHILLQTKHRNMPQKEEARMLMGCVCLFISRGSSGFFLAVLQVCLKETMTLHCSNSQGKTLKYLKYGFPWTCSTCIKCPHSHFIFTTTITLVFFDYLSIAVKFLMTAHPTIWTHDRSHKHHNSISTT